MGSYQEEIKKYESNINFMNRQLDEEKIKGLDASILDAENQKLKDTITIKDEVIDRLYKQYVDVSKQENGCQTEDFIL